MSVDVSSIVSDKSGNFLVFHNPGVHPLRQVRVRLSHRSKTPAEKLSARRVKFRWNRCP